MLDKIINEIKFDLSLSDSEFISDCNAADKTSKEYKDIIKRLDFYNEIHDTDYSIYDLY